MGVIFELFDNILEEGEKGSGHVSYHKTRKGALEAMSATVAKITHALASDYEGDDTNECALSFTVKPRVVLE